MKNEDVVRRLEAIQSYAETELTMLAEELRDDGWEDDDLQAMAEAKRSVTDALLRIADQFPTPSALRLLQPKM